MDLTANLQDDLLYMGYIRFANYASAKTCQDIIVEYKDLVSRYNNNYEFERHSVYQDINGACTGMMVAQNNINMPHVSLMTSGVVSSIISNYQQWLSSLMADLSTDLAQPSGRCFIKHEQKLAQQPIGDLQFFGDILSFQTTEDQKNSKNNSNNPFLKAESILPRYVAMLVTDNNNTGHCLELINPSLGQIFLPELYCGDLILFDNMRLRHRWLSMPQSTSFFQISNSDYFGCHYACHPGYFINRGSYSTIEDGYISQDVDCLKRLKDYLDNEWPKQLQYQLSHRAVFEPGDV
jgi:hypothetical protein